MPTVARWGTSAETISRSDWVCDKSLGKVSLSKSKDVCGVTAAPAPTNPPISGPKALSAAVAVPAIGPKSLSGVVQLPSTGPSSLNAVKTTLNIAPIYTDQSFSSNPASGSAGDIRYSSDTRYIFIHNGTEWHRTNGRQPGEPIVII